MVGGGGEVDGVCTDGDKVGMGFHEDEDLD